MNEVKFLSGGNVEMLDFGKVFKCGVGGLCFVFFGFLVLILLLFSFYMINIEEVGIFLCFGKYCGLEIDVGLGFYFKILIFDQVVKVLIECQFKVEFGFCIEEVVVCSCFLEEFDEVNMFIGDKNVVVVEWVVQYCIIDVYKYIFCVCNVDIIFCDMSEVVMCCVVGDCMVNEVVMIGCGEIECQVEQELQVLCDQYEMGICVDQVVLQNSVLLDLVKLVFNEVNQVEQDCDMLINEVQVQYNCVIFRVEG